MQYKNLGRSGLKVSQLSYGAWVSFGNQLDVKEAKSLLQTCRDHGVNFFDNAEVYANGRAEEIMGQAIRELGWKRSDIVISTKIFWGGPGPNDKGLSRKHIIEGTKNLGRSSLKVSQLFYGSWVSFGNQLDVKEAKSLLQTCRDHGVNFFDNTEVYANGRAEEIMGQAIRELGWKWSDIVVFSKIFWGEPGPNDKGLSRKHIIGGTKASLKRLDMDYVDLIYCHRPDSGTPIEETVRAMNYVIEKGWAFYWGTSEWSAQQITEAWGVAQRLGLVGPVVEQPEYNMLSRHKVETEYLPLYENYGIGLTTWSPLASGVLTGKYSAGNIPADSRFALENYKNLASRSLVDDTLKKVEGLKPIAAELGVPLAQLAIAWCAANPNVSSVITGATKEAQIKENMKAIEVIPLLTPAVMERIEAVIQSKPKRPDSYR